MLQCSRSFTVTACSCSKPGTSSQVGVVHSLYMLVTTVSTSVVSVVFTPTMQLQETAWLYAHAIYWAWFVRD